MTVTAAGHLFLLRADIRHLAVDAWLLPTDTAGTVEPGWLRGDDPLAARVGAWQDGTALRHRRAAVPRVELLPGGRADEPVVVLGAVPLSGTTDAAYHVATVEQAIDVLQERGHPSRLRLAVPALGTAASGGTDVRGSVLAGLVRGLRVIAATRGVDVVLVLSTDAALSAARAVRRSEPGTAWWPALTDEEQTAARALAALAVAGELTLFTGSGTSTAAGLPSWAGLLSHLESLVTARTGTDPLDLTELPLLDRATIVAGALTPEELRAAVGALLSGRRYAIGHALLANLPVREAVTLNYDRLLEQAAADAGRAFAVLPYEPARGRWLLKLHGDLTDEGGTRDVVLTRADYLGAATHRATLTGLVQAVLTTRHLLFVGFGLADDHVHALLHDVRTALARTDEHLFGTALLTHRQPALEALWRRDLTLLTLEDPPAERTGRTIEVFLDLLADAADPSHLHLLDPTWGGVLTAEETALRDLVREAGARVPSDASAAWDALRAALAQYG